MKRGMFVLVVVAALFQATLGVALASGPIVINPDTFGGLSESNQTIVAVADGSSVWVGSEWAGYPVHDGPSIAGPEPFYTWGQQHIKVSYSIDGGETVELGWSDWHNPVLESEALQLEITSGGARSVVVSAELRESDCNNFGGEEQWEFLFDEEISVPKEPDHPADTETSTIFIHTDEAVIQVFPLTQAGLETPWLVEDTALAKRANEVWDCGPGLKFSVAMSQEFILWGHDKETGEYRLIGVGKALAGYDGTTHIWNEGDEASVIDGRILWIPGG